MHTYLVLNHGILNSYVDHIHPRTAVLIDSMCGLFKLIGNNFFFFPKKIFHSLHSCEQYISISLHPCKRFLVIDSYLFSNLVQ